MKRIILLFFVSFIFVLNAKAQKINIGYIYPAGASQGEEVTILIGGQSISSAKQVVISGEGVSAEVIPPSKEELQKFNKKKRAPISDEDNLQLAQNIKVKISIEKDAKPGIRDLKIIGANGAGSNRLFFEVGTFQDVLEREPNNEMSEATFVENLPATLNGYVEKSAVIGDLERGGTFSAAEHGGKDFFCFEAKAGDQIVAQIKARRLVPFLADAVPGWFQAVATVYDEDGKEIAYCDDYSLNADPTLIFKAPKSGKYFLRINDSIYRGREDFVYRINLGVIPYITSVFPLGAKAGEQTKVQIEGVNLDDKEILVASNLEDNGRQKRFYLDKKGLLSNEFIFDVQSRCEERIIHETDQSAESKEQAVSINQNEIINSKIDFAQDEDWFAVDIEKAGNYLFEVIARRVNSPLDAKLSLYNSMGKLIKEVDDTQDESEGYLTHHADPEMTHRMPKAGRYFIRIIDTQSKGGEEFAYRLRCAPIEPAFNLSIEPSSISIPQNGVALLSVFVQRKYNFWGSIDLEFEGLPEGFNVSQMTIPNGAKSVRLAISAPANAKTGNLKLRVRGKARSPQGKEFVREALPVEQMKQAFYISHLLPTSELLCNVSPRQPFSIRLESVRGKQIKLLEDDFVPVKVLIDREEGFNDAIQIMPKMLSEGVVTFQSITIPEGEEEGIIKLETYFWRTPWQAKKPVNEKFQQSQANKKEASSKQIAKREKQKRTKEKQASTNIVSQISADLVVLGTVKASTNNRVAGQARNTVNAALMVNSEVAKLYFPEGKPKLSYQEARKKSRNK